MSFRDRERCVPHNSGEGLPEKDAMHDSIISAPPEFEQSPPIAMPFYAALGRMMVEWNHAEAQMWHLLATIVGQSLEDKQAAAVEHATNYLEAIRAWRACAAHDIALVAHIDDAILPMVLTTDRKGRLVFRGAEVDLDGILLIARHCRTLAFYLRGVVGHLQWAKMTPPCDAIRPALPDRPPLPMGSPVGLYSRFEILGAMRSGYGSR